MMSLMDMVSESIESASDSDNMENVENENTYVNPIIDEIINENEESNHTSDPDYTINLNTIDFETWLNNNQDNLRNCIQIDISSISEWPAHTILLKNINCEKEIVQMYKKANLYKVVDLPCEYMTLYGENGFFIRYNIDDHYTIKFYGTKTTVYQTICVNYNNVLYPIYHNKINCKKLENCSFSNLLSTDQFETLMNDNNNFDFENCVLAYGVIGSVDDPFTNKLDTLNWLANRWNNIYDVPHAIKVDIAMRNILFM